MRVLTGSELAEPPRRMVALAPLRDHQEDRCLLADRHQPLNELDRGRVRPVEVFDRDGHRPILREPLKELFDDFEGAVLERLRRELREAAYSIGLEREAEQRAQIRVELRRALGEERLDAPAKRDADAKLRLVRADAEPVAQEIAKRPVGQRLAVGDAAPLEPERGRRGGRLRLLEGPAQLRDQPALSDPRVAADEEDAARAAERPLECGLGQPELLLATDESGLHSFEAADLAAFSERPLDDRRPHRLGLPLELQFDRLPPGKKWLSLPAGGVVGEHRSGLGARLQASRRVDGIAEGRVLDPVGGADLAQNDRTGRDADADTEPRDAPAAFDFSAVGVHLLHDPQRRAQRALGVVLVRDRCAEEGEDAVAGEILDVAAEPIDVGDDAGDRFADDELDLFRVEPLGERRRADEVGEQDRHDLPLLAKLLDRRGSGHVAHGSHCCRLDDAATSKLAALWRVSCRSCSSLRCSAARPRLLPSPSG